MSEPGNTGPSPSAAGWDPSLYDGKHSFVWKYGAGLLELLAPAPGELILDIGCGTGHLTALIAQSGARVTGIDRSPPMIEQARRAYPEIDFRVADAAALNFNGEFDGILSNAVLHWVKDAAAAARGIAQALKPGGRFVAEFGGYGNVERILRAMRRVLAGANRPDAGDWQPWYFPTVGQYAAVLENCGLEVASAMLFDRMTPLDPGEHSMSAWLEMFAGQFLGDLPPAGRESLFLEAEDLLRGELYRDGIWQVDYRRLRVVAVKTAG